MHASLPDDLTLHIFDLCSAKCLLAVATASRTLRDLHKTNDALWCGRLRARWPREGPALCSLRPRATARQLYRAFASKRDARTQIMRRPERVAVTADERMLLEQKDAADDDEERLAFLVCVGPFAGLACWMRVPDGFESRDMTLLRWEPQSTGTSLTIEIRKDWPHWSTWTAAEVKERYGDQLAQSVYVIDMQTHKCVTLFEGVGPEEHRFSQHGDMITYPPRYHSVRHNYMNDIDEDGAVLEEEDPRLHSSYYGSIEHCVVEPVLSLLVSHDGEVGRDGRLSRLPGTLHLHVADLLFDDYPTATVIHPCSVREYFVDTIAQTFEAGWEREINLVEPSQGMFADNRPAPARLAAMRAALARLDDEIPRAREKLRRLEEVEEATRRREEEIRREQEANRREHAEALAEVQRILAAM